MAKNKKNYYAVAKGKNSGLYKSWGGAGGAEDQVKGFNGAKFKGFYDLGDALEYLTEHDIHVPEHESYVPKDDPIDPDRIQMYTDGSSIQNPGPGGYGVVLAFQGHRKELSAGFIETTNNRMELMACIVGLEALKKTSKVIIFSDSKYVVDGISKGWAQRWRLNGWQTDSKKNVENADLWRRLLAEVERHDVLFKWVKGHAGKKENERCDELAQNAARGTDLVVDEGYENNQNLTLF
jgi:ribonuclease HI